MPWGDGTGPAGMGPRTGRAAGFCAGYDAPGFMNPDPRFGRGFGRGFGRVSGWRRFATTGQYPYQAWEPVISAPVTSVPVTQMTKEQEMQMLENEAKIVEDEQNALNAELGNIKKRITELKKQKKRNKNKIIK